MESLALGQDGQVQRPERNRAGGGEDKLTRRPGADLVSMARQGSRGQPSAAWGSLHRSGSGGTRSNPPGRLRLAPARPSTESDAQLHHDHRRGAQPAPGKGGDETSAAASVGRVPERDPATDLLGKETAGKSARRRPEWVERGAFCPRWRRWNSPDSARIARRRRRRFRDRRRESQGGEVRDRGRSGSV
jgi:hypothetical protein